MSERIVSRALFLLNLPSQAGRVSRQEQSKRRWSLLARLSSLGGMSTMTRTPSQSQTYLADGELDNDEVHSASLCTENFYLQRSWEKCHTPPPLPHWMNVSTHSMLNMFPQLWMETGSIAHKDNNRIIKVALREYIICSFSQPLGVSQVLLLLPMPPKVQSVTC